MAVAAGCFGLARLGLLTVSRETRTVALWPTGGLLLGVLLVCERREWPWLALVAAAGSAGAQVVAGRSVPVAVGLGAATCAAGWLGAAGVRRFVGVPVRLDTLAGGTSVRAGGVGGEWGGGAAGGRGDRSGVRDGVLARVVAVVAGRCGRNPRARAGGAGDRGCRPWRVRVRRSRLVEGVLVLGGLAAVAAAIFTRPVGATRLLLDFVFPVIPFLFWSALRYGSRGVPFANLVLWVIAGAGTAAGRGPFAGPAAGVAGHLVQLESFLAVAVLGVLVGGALADELRERQESLAASNLRLRRESELLRKAERRFRELLETAPDAIVIADHASVVVLVNAQVERLFGYRREDLVGHTVELLVPEHDRARYVALRDAFCADHSLGVAGRGIELCAVHKDGRELPVEVTLGTLETDAGVLVSVAVRDVSERRRLVDQLEQRGRLMDLVHDAIIVREPASGRISYWNRGAEELYGYVAAEACGRSCDLLLGTEFPEPREAISRVLLERGRWEGELWQVGKHGQRILVSSRQALQRDDRGGPVAVIELNSDITQQRQVEDAQRRLAAMVEHSDDAVLGMTSDGVITEWNRGAERLYGYNKTEAIGRNVKMLVPSELFAEGREMLGRVFGGQALVQYETVRIRKDASRVNVSVTVSPVRDRHGTIVAALSISRDITERKRFEGQLQHLADHDALTGLFNRRRFEQELSARSRLRRALRHRRRASGSTSTTSSTSTTRSATRPATS